MLTKIVRTKYGAVRATLDRTASRIEVTEHGIVVEPAPAGAEAISLTTFGAIMQEHILGLDVTPNLEPRLGHSQAMRACLLKIQYIERQAAGVNGAAR